MRLADPAFAMMSHAEPPAGWNEFVEACEPSHFEQTSWWADAEREDGWDASYLVARGAGRIAAGAMVLVRWQHRVGRVGYVVRGPLIDRAASDSEWLRRSIATALKELARQERLALLVVVPPYDGAGLAATLIETGFLEHPPSLPPRGLSPGTITVDLRRDLSQIEGGYRRTLRQEINLARRRGLAVDSGTADDLGVFWAMHLNLCRRRGVSTNLPGPEYVRRVWHEFHRQGRAWLFNARLDDEYLCSLMCLGVGQWFYAWRIGWTTDSKKAYPTQAVFAQAIRTARETGYHYFDFMQIHPEDVARLQRGEQADSPTAGITFFKLGFGGEVRTLSPALDWFPNPLVRPFMRYGALRLLASSPMTKFFRRLAAVR
jgi:hypothetical protein